MFERPKKRYGAYIFDCDGTLVDSMPLHMRAWNAGLAAALAPFVLDGPGFLSVAGMSLEQTVRHWEQIHGTELDLATIVRVKNAYYEEHKHTIPPIEAVVEYARELAKDGLPIAVASGGRLSDVCASLRQVGIEHLFATIVGADDVEHSKPAPDLFLLAARRLGVAASDCLVIEDSPLGVLAADAAGMDSIPDTGPWSQ
ncbi:MAG: HAD family phosphatase [Verrucomicrobia bacterium]|nr:HAD family phosphatase [Verrucomicrobiota bacterium]